MTITLEYRKIHLWFALYDTAKKNDKNIAADVSKTKWLTIHLNLKSNLEC